jgi:hypothetical protein
VTIEGHDLPRRQLPEELAQALRRISGSAGLLDEFPEAADI